MSQPRTLFDKIWESHLVDTQDDGTSLIYIDRHLVHEVTSPQAFEGLRSAGRAVRRPELTLAVADHNVPTTDRSGGIAEPESRLQVETLSANCAEFGVKLFDMNDIRQGIVHIIGPEQGFTLPGMTIVCGDSHTSTHGAFGALAFGIGTSEVEHVLATQTLIQQPARNMRIKVDGDLPAGVTAKDLILAIIGKIGTAGGTGHVIEYAGQAIRDLSMEGRMTVCNMSIEAGARAGLIAPDETTFDYVKGRAMAPKGGKWEQALAFWRTLPSDEGASYDKEVTLATSEIAPQVTWGTSPQDVVPVTGRVPDPAAAADESQRQSMERALDYMGLTAGTPIQDIAVLFRSSYHSFDLELELQRHDIPFVKRGGFKFIETAHVKDVLAHLRIVANPRDAVSWHRVLLLIDGVGPKSAQHIFDWVQGGEPAERLETFQGRSPFVAELRRLAVLWRELESDRVPPGDKMARVAAHYVPLMRMIHREDYPKRERDLEHLISIAGRYRSLEGMLADMALEPPSDSVGDVLAGTMPDEGLLTLSTIHSAKGLEWRAVFVIWLVDGRFPPSFNVKDDDEIEEERRLLYVACTRAKDQLYLTYPIDIYDWSSGVVLGAYLGGPNQPT